jgi:hypothetical protein
MSQEEFLAEIARLLAAAGIPFMVAGSHASSFYGHPRATQDVDMVIDPSAGQLEQLLTSLGREFYVSPDAARDALQRRSMFNIIDLKEGWKADLIVRRDRPFSLEEFNRRQVRAVHGVPLPVASPEDIILTKLEWDRITPSERQLKDALGVAQAQRENLDETYLRQWATQLGVADRLEELLGRLDKPQGPPDA